jgi:sulfotransferase family protein
MARDPKDSFYSLYSFIHDLFDLQEWVPPDEFLRSYYVERFGTGHDIGNVWGHFLDWHRLRDRMLWLHYEDLLEDLPRCLRGIADFMQIELDSKHLQLVLQRSSIDSMRSIASKLNPSPANYVGKLVIDFGADTSQYAKSLKHGKMRRGVAGDGRKNLSEQIIQALDTEWTRRITPVLGYRNNGEMREECSFLNK